MNEVDCVEADKAVVVEVDAAEAGFACTDCGEVARSGSTSRTTYAPTQRLCTTGLWLEVDVRAVFLLRSALV